MSLLKTALHRWHQLAAPFVIAPTADHSLTTMRYYLAIIEQEAHVGYVAVQGILYRSSRISLWELIMPSSACQALPPLPSRKDLALSDMRKEISLAFCLASLSEIAQQQVQQANCNHPPPSVQILLQMRHLYNHEGTTDHVTSLLSVCPHS